MTRPRGSSCWRRRATWRPTRGTPTRGCGRRCSCATGTRWRSRTWNWTSWGGGRTLLARGGGGTPQSVALRDAATKDLAKPATAAERAALADLYWRLRDAQEPPLRFALAARAVHWYELAIPGLSGLAKLAA